MKTKAIIISIVLLGALTACKSQYEMILNSSDAGEKYKYAMELFEKERYGKAAELFESLSMLTKGTDQDDTVQFFWGMSNYKYGDYTTAESNFTTFIATFPLSSFFDEAQYLRLDCMYRGTYRYELDPLPTQKALSAMRVFQMENPSSIYREKVFDLIDDLEDRLDMKAYKAAHLYYHMEDYLAAHYALKNVLRDNAENRYREDILYYTAMSAYKYALNSIADKQKERYMEFVDDYLNIISEYPETKYRKELDNLYQKVQKILKKHEDNG